ncbi:hypothetical protein KTT_51310 [Tengunoibacter tsumagoiensis]|uniref:Uncharacterized protein n=1 Tax=Tengunoibacter tsumagoiensis TaxID=2014871 RepID=A0A402A7Z5_9CHLR|nr:hypothetical protein KTT_51310 [Tengunoibacter tsumagoiensis]
MDTLYFVLYANQVPTHIKMGNLQQAWDATLHAEKFVLHSTNPRKIDVTHYQIQVAEALGDLKSSTLID